MALTAARKIGENLYAIDSEMGDRSYRVDLSGPVSTCSCPHYTYRCVGTDQPCKHIAACIAQAPRIELLEKAARCSDEQLNGLLERYGSVSPEIGGALRVERSRRREAAASEAQLRDIFA